ncbi:MAG: 4-phosphoerythronate dehydrogenase, partial [Nitrincola sp.]|nr:4-phosphoerythronate dehydrogenase [Nitrincola sp.]
MSAIKIVADENIPALDPLFTSIGEVKRVPGRRLSAADLEGADLLLVRSVTQVNHDLLKDSQVKFVGTATIGTDHIDQLCLQDMGISFASAPGCNADAVTEYVLSVLLHLAEEQGFLLTEKTVGIVGVGNVGSRLQARLSALGVQVMLCDPPRAIRENPEGFVPLEQLLQQADIVTLHTPLTREGDHATHHLLNSARLSQLKTNAILINAGRGAVIDNAALLAFSLDRDDVTLVLDVWEHEPRVDPLLASRVKIATPHIAGYTLEGKIRGTWMLYQAYCRSSDREEVYRFEDLLPKPSISAMTL